MPLEMTQRVLSTSLSLQVIQVAMEMKLSYISISALYRHANLKTRTVFIAILFPSVRVTMAMC